MVSPSYLRSPKKIRFQIRYPIDRVTRWASIAADVLIVAPLLHGSMEATRPTARTYETQVEATEPEMAAFLASKSPYVCCFGDRRINSRLSAGGS